MKPAGASPTRDHLKYITIPLSIALLAVLLPDAAQALTFTSLTSGNFTSNIWDNPGFPGPADTAIIDSGHQITALTAINVSALTINANGTLIVGASGRRIVRILADAVNVMPGGVLRGFDAIGGGGTVSIRGQSLGSLNVQNNGLIRGGNPSGFLFIHDSAADDACANGSQILATNGVFQGGSDKGSVYMVAGTIGLTNSTVQGGSGSPPFNRLNRSIAGNVYIGGVNISISSGTTITSGSNSTPGGIAGTVKIIAYSCPSTSIGSLVIDPTSSVNTGTPIANNCPGVLLFSSGTSTILGTVGAPGASNCLYWDPPDLELRDTAEIFSDRITIVGDNFRASNLTGTALTATDNIEITLTPGGVLDLEDLPPGTDYFQATSSISLCADDIRLAPGVALGDLMSPAPQLCPGAEVFSLSLTPGSAQTAEPGSDITIPLQVVNVGNTGRAIDVTIEDSAGWFINGPFLISKFLDPGGTVLISANISVPNEPFKNGTILTLTAQTAGQQPKTEISLISIPAGSTKRASVDSNGVEGNEESFRPDISDYGRFVAFSSAADNLVAGDLGFFDVFVHDCITRDTTRISVDLNGQQADDVSFSPAVSADGRFIAFQSNATNLIAADTNGTGDIFVRDRGLQSTTRVSVDSNGAEVLGASQAPDISADGRFVTFSSGASTLVPGDSNFRNDIFLHDRLNGLTTLVSVDATGTQPNEDCFSPAISADGQHVAFHTTANNLATADFNGVADVFLRDRQAGNLLLVSTTPLGQPGNGQSLDPSISSDGRFVAFASDASDLVAGDTNGLRDIFLRDLQTGQTTLVSVDSNGVQANSLSDFAVVSSDGFFVAFASDADNLVAGDTNSDRDIFVRDLRSGITSLVSVDSAGVHGNGFSEAPVLSADGSSVAFESRASNLVAADNNDRTDVFVRSLSVRQAGIFADGFESGDVSAWSVSLPSARFVSPQLRAAEVVTKPRPEVSPGQLSGR